MFFFYFFFSSRRRHTRYIGDWSSDVCSSDLYYLKCPECGCRFWAEPELAKTSIFDGSLQGFRCPEKKCGATVAWERSEERRVGKECRCGGAGGQYKKKAQEERR